MCQIWSGPGDTKVKEKKRAYWSVEDAILLIQLIEDVVEAQTRVLCLAGMG